MNILRNGRMRGYLVGGPWAGKNAVVPEQTMTIVIGKYRGRYVRGVWENVR